jgi:PBSX family phage terminase large subunit
MIIHDPYIPLPSQHKFHSDEAQYRAYVGSYRSGKSFAGCKEGIRQSMKWPRNVGLIGRAFGTDLRDTTMEVFFDHCMPAALMEQCDWKKGERLLTFPNGSKIMFRPLEDADKFLSLELGWFYIDEAVQPGCERAFEVLQSRINKPGVRRCGWITTNPGGYDWIYKKFVEAEDPAYSVIHARMDENIHLPPEYVAKMRRELKGWKRKRYFEGLFEAVEGAIFDGFNPAIHIEDPHPLPKGVVLYDAIDPGTSNPSAWVLIAWDPDIMRGWVIDELCYHNPTVAHFANKVLQARRKWKRPIVKTTIDPTIRDASTGLTIRQLYARHGIVSWPANKDRSFGFDRVSEVLAHDSKLGDVRLKFFRTCQQTIKQISAYRWKVPRTSVANPPEEPVKKDDHCVDAARFALCEVNLFEDEPDDSHMETRNLSLERQCWAQVESDTRWVLEAEDADFVNYDYDEIPDVPTYGGTH